MKSIVFSLFLSACAACAQTPNTPSPATPPTPSSAPAAATPAATSDHPDWPPDTVVATFEDGRKVTLGELMDFVRALPPQMQQNAMRNRKDFVQQFVLMHHLAEMAEKAKLDQANPTKEALAFNRMYLLMNAQLHEELNGIIVQPADSVAFYDKNKDRFAQVKVKTIYVAFSENSEAAKDGKKHLTEAEAQAKIVKLHAQIVGGADFVKLVRENSDDQTSAAKDGDFGVIRRTDNLPEAIHHAIFALKTGEVSEPVKQPNGFYLFRAEEVTTQPYPDVEPEISKELKQTRFNLWMDETKRGLNIKLNDEVFNSAPAAAKK